MFVLFVFLSLFWIQEYNILLLGKVYCLGQLSYVVCGNISFISQSEISDKLGRFPPYRMYPDREKLFLSNSTSGRHKADF